MLNVAVERYLLECLGLKANISPWAQAGRLPFYLQDAYEFASIELLGAAYVLLMPRDARLSASELRKRMDTLAELTGAEGIFVAAAMSSSERKRLIDQHVPFIVPGNQLYLPDIGIDLREYFRSRRRPADKGLTPATQALLISALLQPWRPEVHPAELGARFGYTAMTLSRAVKELEAVGLAEVVGKGRERWLHFLDGPRAIWMQALPLLRSPVKKSVWLWPDRLPRQLEHARLAGESALASMTLLSEPKTPVQAISADQWKVMQQQGVEELPANESGALALQVWSYSPELVEGAHVVDPLSLLLSLRDEHDERVRQAMDELEEQLPW